jgi:hypothetical protein
MRRQLGQPKNHGFTNITLLNFELKKRTPGLLSPGVNQTKPMKNYQLVVGMSESFNA